MTHSGLTAMAGEMLADARTGKNGRHDLIGMLRQSVFGRLAGYEDVNDAERLRRRSYRGSGRSLRASTRVPSQSMISRPGYCSTQIR